MNNLLSEIKMPFTFTTWLQFDSSFNVSVDTVHSNTIRRIRHCLYCTLQTYLVDIPFITFLMYPITSPHMITLVSCFVERANDACRRTEADVPPVSPAASSFTLSSLLDVCCFFYPNKSSVNSSAGWH